MATNNYFKVKNGLEFPSQDALQVTDTTGPSIRPSLLLDFANTKQLDPRITFSRPTTATYYDGKTVVKAEENLLQYSQEFDNAVWSKYNISILSNTTAAPDGTNTADSFVETTNTTAFGVGQSLATIVGSTYTLSLYAKASARGFIGINLGTSGNGAGAWAVINITNGATLASGKWPGTVNYSISATSAGNGWWRIVITADNMNYSSSTAQIMATDGNTTAYPWSYAGTLGTNALYLWGVQIEQRSTVTAYTPTTTAPITNYIPVLQTAVSNDARFDHDPVTGESKGLLIEEQRTNLVTYSQDFTNSAWYNNSTVSVASNSNVAPDGTLTATKIVPSTASGAHYTVNGATTSGTVYTTTVFAKAAGYTWLKLVNYTSYANFDLANGVVGSNFSGTGVSRSITPVGNGWYRCTFTFTCPSTTTSQGVIISPNNSDNANYNTNFAGDGYSGIYIWGAQLEAGSFPTSYIPTVASQVTRSADSASMTGSNFSSWYRADEGTVYAESTFPQVTSSRVVDFWLNNTNTITLYKSGSNLIGEVYQGSSQAYLSIAASSNNKAALTYKTNDIAYSVNASAVSTDTSAVLPIPTTLYIGQYGGGGSQINGTIKRIAYYPKRLSNAELQAITS